MDVRNKDSFNPAGAENAPRHAYYKGTDGAYYFLIYTGKNGKGWRKQFVEPGFPYEEWVPPTDAPFSPTQTTEEAEKATINLEYSATIRPKGKKGEDPTSYRYPADLLDNVGDTDFVLFDFYNYQPPFRKRKESKQAQLFLDDKQKVPVYNETINLYNETGLGVSEYAKTGYPQLIMYMPEDISDTFKADWEGKAFGSTTAGLLAAAGQNTVTDKLAGAFQAAGEAFNKLPVNAAAAAVTSLAKSITGDNIGASDVFGSISGVVRNPNVELLFQKMNLRTFDLTFKMAPYSKKDATNIMEIIKTFKKAMLPQYALGQDDKVFGFDTTSNRSLQAGFIKVPKVCMVSYMKGSSQHPYLPKYKMCAITDVNVNYTPDNNYATLPGGMPAAVELKISFMETKLVFSEDITDRGF